MKIKLFFIPIGLIFGGVGGFSAWQGFQSAVSEEPFLPVVLIPWTVGVAFTVVGLGMLAVGLFGKEIQPGTQSPLAWRKRLMGMRTPEDQWRDGQLRSHGVEEVVGAAFKAAFGSLCAAPTLYVGWIKGVEQGQPWYAAWLLFAVIPLFLLGKTLYRWLRWRKYGTSICQLERIPSQTSGEFKFLVRSGITQLPEGDATVTFRCEKREWQKSGDDRYLSVTVLWREQKTIPVQPMGLGIAGAFQIPHELPEANARMAEGIFWVLDVSSRALGIDYLATFDMAFKRKA